MMTLLSRYCVSAGQERSGIAITGQITGILRLRF